MPTTPTRGRVCAIVVLSSALAATSLHAQINPHRSLCSPRTGSSGQEICVAIEATPQIPGVPVPPPTIIQGTTATPLAVTATVGDYDIAGAVTFVSTPSAMEIDFDGTITRTSMGPGGVGAGVLLVFEGAEGDPLSAASGSLSLIGGATSAGQIQIWGSALTDSNTTIPDFRTNDFGGSIRESFNNPVNFFTVDLGLGIVPPPNAPVIGIRSGAYVQLNDVGAVATIPAGASVRPPGSPTSRRGGSSGPHFQCYEVEAGSTGHSVHLDDQFYSGKAKLGEIKRLCTPTSKNEEETPNPDLHLVCYEILDGADSGRAVSAINQLETIQMGVGKARELCVPSIKRVLEEERIPPPPPQQQQRRPDGP